MAEALVLGPALIAFVQLADRVIDICKHYIGSVRDAPNDLRIILVEVSSLKAILQNVQFLDHVDDAIGKRALKSTLDDCKRSVLELEELFPRDHTGILLTQGQGPQDGNPGPPTVGPVPSSAGRKRQRITQTLAILAWPLKVDRAKKSLDEIARHKGTITLALLAESSQEIHRVKGAVKEVYVALMDDRKRKCCDWLETTDPSDIHQRACSLREEDTGLWILETKEWKDWITRSNRFLWVHGIPGAGKTVLVSFLVQQLQLECRQPRPTGSPRRAVVYYYCYFKHNQDETLPFLQWVVGQLCRQAQLVPHSITTWYDQGQRPALGQLLAGLEDILKLGEFGQVFIVVDAIDECKEPRMSLLRLVRILVADQRFAMVQLLASSRDYLDIQSAFSHISVPITMQVDQVQTDIRKHVYTMMRDDYRFVQWPEELRREVGDKLAVQAKGMFRWAVCQLDILRRVIAVDDIRNALESLPETLDETYERIFAVIPQHDRRIAQRTMCLLSTPQDQLNAFDVSDPDSFVSMVFEKWDMTHSDKAYNFQTIKDICGCLVTQDIIDGSRELDGFHPMRFAHFTVQEFLFSPRLQDNRDERVRFFALTPDIITSTLLTTTLTAALAYEDIAKRTSMTSTTSNAYINWNFLSIHGFRALKEWDHSTHVTKGLKDVALRFLRSRLYNMANREDEKGKVVRVLSDVSKW